MAVDAQWIRYGKSFSGYLARPARASSLPGVVVIQEAWGVDAHIEDVTRRFALAGYVALAPDCFAHDGARPAPLTAERLKETQAFVNELGTKVMDVDARAKALAQKPADEAARLQETMGMAFGRAHDIGASLPSVLAAIQHLRGDAGARGVATVGFCMGGSLSALAACHDAELRGAVIFYGAPPPDDELANLRCPLLAFHGSLDARLMATLPAFEAAMKAAGKALELRVFEGAQHAFFNDNRPTYDAAAARAAYARTLGFLVDVMP